MLKVKRIYDPPRKEDGARVLVDRLWPRGLSKQQARVDLWLKEIAPSNELRKWFGHDPARWREFQTRYRKELRDKTDLARQIRELQRSHGTVTLLYAARDEEHNQAIALQKFLKGGRA